MIFAKSKKGGISIQIIQLANEDSLNQSTQRKSILKKVINLSLQKVETKIKLINERNTDNFIGSLSHSSDGGMKIASPYPFTTFA